MSARASARPAQRLHRRITEQQRLRRSARTVWVFLFVWDNKGRRLATFVLRLSSSVFRPLARDLGCLLQYPYPLILGDLEEGLHDGGVEELAAVFLQDGGCLLEGAGFLVGAL